MLNKTMKAVGFYKYFPIEHPESLLDITLNKPVAVGSDLLVRVKAVSVNPVDVIVRAPKDTVEDKPKVIGWDVAGVVEQTGPDCKIFKPGDEVYYAGSYIRDGGNSEFHLVDERIVGKKPDSLDYAEAAALPLTTITAWEALFDRLGIPSDTERNRGKSLLIIGAAGGVGSIAIQLAKWAGLTVIGTASRPESSEWIHRMGADHSINHRQPLLPQLQSMGHEHVHYIFNLSSTDVYWNQMVESIAPQGKICGIVDASGPIDLTQLKFKSATFVWEMMFTRPIFQTEDQIEQHKLLNRVAEMVDAGILQTTLTKRLEPFNAITMRRAHAIVESGSSIGKVVVEHFPVLNA